MWFGSSCVLLDLFSLVAFLFWRDTSAAAPQWLWQTCGKHVASLCIAFTTIGVNQLDLAPLHAGKIFGLTTIIGNLASIAGPHAVSVFTSHRSTRSEWQNVFFLSAAVYAVGAVIFVIFGSGNRQHWADDTRCNMPV